MTCPLTPGSPAEHCLVSVPASAIRAEGFTWPPQELAKLVEKHGHIEEHGDLTHEHSDLDGFIVDAWEVSWFS